MKKRYHHDWHPLLSFPTITIIIHLLPILLILTTTTNHNNSDGNNNEDNDNDNDNDPHVNNDNEHEKDEKNDARIISQILRFQLDLYRACIDLVSTYVFIYLFIYLFYIYGNKNIRCNKCIISLFSSNNDQHPNRLIIRVFPIFCQSTTYRNISSDLNQESNNSPSPPSSNNSCQILYSDILREVTTLYRKPPKVHHLLTSGINSNPFQNYAFDEEYNINYDISKQDTSSLKVYSPSDMS